MNFSLLHLLLESKYAKTQFSILKNEFDIKPEEYLSKAICKYAKPDGYLNYWDMIPEIEHIVEKYGIVFINVMLVRSFIGLSKKLKNKLNSFGLQSKKINQVSENISIEINDLKTLKQVQRHIIVLSVRAFAEEEVVIRAINPQAIRIRYMKQDEKKIVAGKHHNDYYVETYPYGQDNKTFSSLPSNQKELDNNERKRR